MIIALASPRVASSVDEAIEKSELLIAEAARRRAEIVCFPEAYIPGLRGLDFEVPPFDRRQHDEALARVADAARRNSIATIIGMELVTDHGSYIAAHVIDRDGRLLGHQTKNQLDPAEEAYYVPGASRRVFEAGGVRFGIAICHEGFRYPETVRWAAVRGAQIVFHPHMTGSDRTGGRPREWGDPRAPYYEKAMMCRALENSIYFASLGCATRFPESATSILTPEGECQAYLPYGEEGVLVEEIDLDRATALLAKRYAPERYSHGD